MHFRLPSFDHGVVSFVWALVFGLFIFFGALAIGVSKGTALIVAAVAAAAIFLFVRTRGEEDFRRA